MWTGSQFGSKWLSGDEASPGGGATLLVYDEYVADGASESLFVHVPNTDNIGTGWVKYGDFDPTHTVENGYVIASGATNSTAGWDLDGLMPVILEQQLNSINQSAPTVNLRVVDDDNRFWLRDSQSGGNHTLQLFERTGGSNTVRASGTAFDAPDSTSRAWYSDNQSVIEAGWDRGEAIISYTTSTHNTSTVYGLGNQTARSKRFIMMGGTTDPADLYTP